MSYDAWGRRRNPYDWSYTNITTSNITDRGYTMHEMLDNFDLINMNGRAYDPLLGQFLSPDPYVSHPENPQGYNRYAYCLNNPLKYTDPSGYCDWQWFITQNLKSAELSYRSYKNHGINSETAFSRDFEQTKSKIISYKNWEEKYNMFKKYYNSNMTLAEKIYATLRAAEKETGKKPWDVNMILNGKKADYLNITFKNKENQNWTFIEEVETNQFELDNSDYSWFMKHDSKNYGPATDFGEDASTLTFYANGIAGGGFGGGGSYGSVKKESSFINTQGQVGSGWDISAGVNINLYWNTSNKAMTAKSLSGPAGYVNIGLGIFSVTLFGDISRNSYDGSLDFGSNLIGFSFGLTFSPFPVSGSFGTTYTSPPKILKKY
jgi:RHS repeat-associated protein